jgi:hypothetical protein
MAKDVLGHIELDPASDAFANTVVGAARFYTRQDDGLSQPWEARTVYLNPPGGRLRNQSQQKLFYWKLVQEWQQGRVGSAVFLAFSIELAQEPADSILLGGGGEAHQERGADACQYDRLPPSRPAERAAV